MKLPTAYLLLFHHLKHILNLLFLSARTLLEQSLTSANTSHL